MSMHYQHSGTSPLFSVVSAFLAGLAAALVAAVVYSYAVVWIPFVYINFFLTMGFGGLIGGIVGWRAKSGHIRSRLVPAVIGCLCGCVGLYAAWGVDFIARASRAGVELPSPIDAFHPRALAAYMNLFYHQGLWGIGRHGGTVSGVFLAIVWLAEAGAIVGLATMVPWSKMADMAFCEECQCWCETESDVRRLTHEGADEAAERFNMGDLKPLSELFRADPSAADFLRLDVTGCPSCGENQYLTVAKVNVTVDKDGDQKVNATTLVDKLIITKADVERVRDAGRELPPPPDVRPSEPPIEAPSA